MKCSFFNTFTKLPARTAATLCLFILSLAAAQAQTPALLDVLGGKDTTFNYIASEQFFVAPRTGYYRLEAWGASGGSESGNYGFGGYVSGVK
jgi:hypothetical protein